MYQTQRKLSQQFLVDKVLQRLSNYYSHTRYSQLTNLKKKKKVVAAIQLKSFLKHYLKLKKCNI